jgi:iron complex outermembrane recepter protein
MKTAIRISDAIAWVLSGLPLSGLAQDAKPPQAADSSKEEVLGEVTVTGYRASLRDALEVKRASLGVVEAISSKDIGVLPDVTIAETLARLPGLNTVRDRGNDSQAAIRGLGPRMVVGLLNGREMASSEPDRNVRWEIFPSEIVSGVQVYKSSQADLVSGGISGTVDIQTLRPLDYEGPALTFRAGPSYYDGGTSLPDQDQVGYRTSGAYVAKFSPNVALVVAGSLQKQQNGYESVGGGGWNNAAPGPVEEGGPRVQNPWGASIDEKAIETTRASLSPSLQWRTGDVFEGRLDALGSKVKLSEHDVGGWYSDWGNWDGFATGTAANPGFTNNVIENGSLVATDMTFDSTFNSYNSRYRQEMTLAATGLNGKWSLDDWTLVADLAYSQAERYGIWQAVRMNANVGRMSYDYTGRFPELHAERDVYTAASLGLMTPVDGQADVSHLRDTMSTATLDAIRDIEGGILDAIKFGVRYSDRSKEDSEPATAVIVSPLSTTPVNASLLKPWNYKEFTTPAMVTGDFDEVATALYGAAGLDLLNYDYKNTPFVSEVEEKVTEAYVMVNYAMQWGSMPVDGNFGIRAIDVDQTSTGPSNGADISVSNSYTKMLPSITGRLELGTGQYLKFGLSRALSRPPLNDLRVDRSFSTTAPYSGGGGNPYLKPYVSDQLDLSFEKYFRKDGLFAIAGFAKRIHNYIGFDTRNMDIEGFPQPVRFTSPFNAQDTGTLKGVELSFQTPFFFIPRLENFGIYSNVTLTDSDIYENSPLDNPFPMNGVAKETFLVDLYYAGSKVDTRLGFKYHSPYTILFTWASSGLQAVKSETLLDYSMDYKMNNRMSFRFQAANLLNTPLHLYDNNNESQIARNDVYGRRYLLDVTFKF